jgi:hypothetical protein
VGDINPVFLEIMFSLSLNCIGYIKADSLWRQVLWTHRLIISSAGSIP